MTETLYITGATSQFERLERINQIIIALEMQILDNIGNEPITEYSLNDGQVTIRTVYRSVEQMTKAIFALEKLKNKLLNELNGRGMVLRPWQGLN
jgi:hypothetical protein